MDRTLDFANVNWGMILKSNNAMYTNSLNLFSIVRLAIFFGIPKIRAWSIFTLLMPYVKT